MGQTDARMHRRGARPNPERASVFGPARTGEGRQLALDTEEFQFPPGFPGLPIEQRGDKNGEKYERSNQHAGSQIVRRSALKNHSESSVKPG